MKDMEAPLQRERTCIDSCLRQTDPFISPEMATEGFALLVEDVSSCLIKRWSPHLGLVITCPPFAADQPSLGVTALVAPHTSGRSPGKGSLKKLELTLGLESLDSQSAASLILPGMCPPEEFDFASYLLL